MNRIHNIHGGIHPPERKALSLPGQLRTAGIPRQLVLPLAQHIGKPLCKSANACWAASDWPKLTVWSVYLFTRQHPALSVLLNSDRYLIPLG